MERSPGTHDKESTCEKPQDMTAPVSDDLTAEQRVIHYDENQSSPEWPLWRSSKRKHDEKSTPEENPTTSTQDQSHSLSEDDQKQPVKEEEIANAPIKDDYSEDESKPRRSRRLKYRQNKPGNEKLGNETTQGPLPEPPKKKQKKTPKVSPEGNYTPPNTSRTQPPTRSPQTRRVSPTNHQPIPTGAARPQAIGAAFTPHTIIQQSLRQIRSNCGCKSCMEDEAHNLTTHMASIYLRLCAKQRDELLTSRNPIVSIVTIQSHSESHS